MGKPFFCFCPAEDYRLERCLAWLEAEHGPAKVLLLALPERVELAVSQTADFGRLTIEVIPYPACGVAGYYSPEHVSDEIVAAAKSRPAAEGVVLLSGPPARIRYMPEYITPAIKKDYNYFRILHKLGVKNVWTYDATGARKHNMPMLLDDFVDRHKGERAWVMGNGPSLKTLDLAPLKDEVTFGSNRIYLGYEDWGFSNTYWGVIDSLQCEKHAREWERSIPEEVTKFYPFEYLNLLHLNNSCPVNFYPSGHPECKTNFMDPLNLENLNKASNFSKAPDVIYLGHTVLYGLLQIAALMGCDPIYLIGVDHNYRITQKDKKRGLWSNADSANHFHEGYGKSGGQTHDFHLPEMEAIEKSFDYASLWAGEYGVTIENATPGSKLPSFPMIEFTDALKNGVRATFPALGASAEAVPATAAPARKGVTASILVCTPDIYSEHTQKCLESIREHTQGLSYELLVFDNGKFGRFQHPLEINRALEIALGDVLVTLDDDVEVTEGWLDALLELATPDVGIVGNIHLNLRDEAHGTIRHAGGWIDLDGSPKHFLKPIESAVAVPYVCSACMLINDRTLRFNLDYKKYYQEAELCLDSWERGKKVLVSPHRVYHYGQGQMEALGMGRDEILAQSAEDRATFCLRWVETGRLETLYDRIRPLVDFELPLLEVLDHEQSRS